MTRPRGVRWRKPSCRRYGSYTSSIVSGSSPSDTASVERPTGPPPNLSEIADRSSRSTRSRPGPVDLEQLERLACDLDGHDPGVTHLGDVADAPEDPVRDPWCAPRPASDLVGRLVGDLDAEDAGRAANDRRELVLLVVPQPERHAEPVAKRRREETRARGRADERERRQVERERPRPSTLADDDVEPKVLERRVEDLLDRAVDAMDLVDEEDVLHVEAGEDRGHVALPLEGRPCHRANADVELLANDRRECRLPETRGADEQDVVERLAASLGRLQRDLELLLRSLLPDEVVESTRPERLLDLLVALAQRRGEELAGHGSIPDP